MVEYCRSCGRDKPTRRLYVRRELAGRRTWVAWGWYCLTCGYVGRL